jgi:hypothetical protein
MQNRNNVKSLFQFYYLSSRNVQVLLLLLLLPRGKKVIKKFPPVGVREGNSKSHETVIIAGLKNSYERILKQHTTDQVTKITNYKIIS